MGVVVEKVDPDWYEDGVDGPTGRLENLWRLDFVVGANAFQAQLFGLLDDWLQADEFDESQPSYQSFRLFLERDNRIPEDQGGDNERWDYACDCWPLSEDEALELLGRNTDMAVKLMCDKIDRVAQKANERGFIREHARRHPAALAKVEKYWAELDARS